MPLKVTNIISRLMLELLVLHTGPLDSQIDDPIGFAEVGCSEPTTSNKVVQYEEVGQTTLVRDSGAQFTTCFWPF